MGNELVKLDVRGYRVSWRERDPAEKAVTMRRVQATASNLEALFRTFNGLISTADETRTRFPDYGTAATPVDLNIALKDKRNLRRIIRVFATALNEVYWARMSAGMWFPELIVCDGYQVFPPPRELYETLASDKALPDRDEVNAIVDAIDQDDMVEAS